MNRQKTKKARRKLTREELAEVRWRDFVWEVGDTVEVEPLEKGIARCIWEDVMRRP